MISDLSEFLANVFGPFAVAAAAVAFGGALVLMVLGTFMKMVKRWQE